MWTSAERTALEPVLAWVLDALGSLVARRVLVLCSAGGALSGRLAGLAVGGEVIGLELDEGLLAASQALRAAAPDLPLRFERAPVDHIPYPTDSFDAVVSEFVVDPTTTPTQIGQPEMARVLRPGGEMVITDVIVPAEPPEPVRVALLGAGLEYLCVATPDDFVGWMAEAGLERVEVHDLTPLVRPGWDLRLADGAHPAAAEHLLGTGPWSLGRGVRYLGVTGRKP